MPRRKFNNNFQRIENKKPTKKEIKEHEQSIIENRIEFYNKISEKTNKSKLIEVSQHIINEYFDAEKIKFQTNKVHVIQGENGHGKSTLLTNIANAYFMDSLENHDHKIKKCCTNKNVAKVLNKGLPMNPYQMEDRPEGNTKFGLYSGLDYNTTPSIKNDEYVITWYIDFGVSYFTSANVMNTYTQLDVTDMLEKTDKKSNGERKIRTLKDLFLEIDIIFKNDIPVNILIILDEPEQALSINNTKLFKRKVLKFIKKFQNLENKNKDFKGSFTFIIASHSLVWEIDYDTNKKFVKIHQIEDFKNKDSNEYEFKKQLKL